MSVNRMIFLVVLVLALALAGCEMDGTTSEEVPVEEPVEEVVVAGERGVDDEAAVTDEASVDDEAAVAEEESVDDEAAVAEEESMVDEPASTVEPIANGNLVEITAEGFQFGQVPDELPPGAATFQFNNNSAVTHSARVQRLPEGISVADYQAEVAPVFQEAMDLLNEGQVDAAMAALEALPAWYDEVFTVGGPGLTGPGESSHAGAFLEPGTYMIICDVKTDGVFHAYNATDGAHGMVAEFTVPEGTWPSVEPEADLLLNVSDETGFELVGEPKVGRQVVGLIYQGHHVDVLDEGVAVHLVRLDDDVDMDALAEWMDWQEPNGLETPAPATFLGGRESTNGVLGFFIPDLEPGDYAFIGEVPDPIEKGMFLTFAVP